MNIWVLYFIIISFINKTNCIFVLNNITEIDEGLNSDINLFIKYNSSHLLGILNNEIYLITPFRAEKKNFIESSPKISEITNIKYLGNELFALICLDDSLIEIYNINGKRIEYIKSSHLVINNKCGVDYENNNFYISFLGKNNDCINCLVYSTVEYNNNQLNYKENLTEIFNEKINNIFSFNNKSHNFIIIIKNKNYNKNMRRVSDKTDLIEVYLCLMGEITNNEKNFTEFLNQEIETIDIIDGFKNDENSFIIYGLYDQNNVTIIKINFITKHLNYYYITILSNESIIKDTISIFLKDINQIYISFYDSKYFYFELFSLEEEDNSNIIFKKEFSISSIFFPTFNITFLKGFLFQNIIIFILKNQEENLKTNWKMITFRSIECEDYKGYIYENDEKIIDISEINNKEYNNKALSFLNNEGIQLKYSYYPNIENNRNNFEIQYNIQLSQEFNNFTTKYLFYITGFENLEEGNDELKLCDFNLTRCHKSCLNCYEYSNDELNTECIECNNNILYYKFIDNKKRCGLKNLIYENYYFDDNYKIFLNCKDNCKYCKNNKECLQCYDNFTYTSKNDCIPFPCSERTVWYYQENNIICSRNKSCLNSLPFFNLDTYECVNDPNIFNNKNVKKCNENEEQDNLECYLKNIKTEDNTTFSIEIYDSKKQIPGKSKIDLGKCEDILRDFYNIKKPENLNIKIMETIIKNKPTKKVEYEVYDNNFKKLNLSLCENEIIKISSPIIDKNLIKYEYGKELIEKGIDIYNSSDEYFNDYCNNQDINIGTDIPIKDRKKDIFVNISLCEDGCIYDGINYETELINCKCDKSILNNNKDEEEVNKGNKIMEKISKKINLKIFSCYKYIFDLKNLKGNYGFLYSSSVFVVLNIFTILHFTKTFSLLTKKIYNSINLPEGHSTILHKNQQLKPAPIKKKRKKIENKDYENILKDTNIYSSRINNGNSSSYRELNIIKRDNIIKMEKLKKKNENIYGKKKRKKNKYSINEKINNDIIIKPKEKEDEKDYEEMYYYEASKDDDRNLVHISFSNFISKIDLIEIIFYPKPYNILFVTLSGYLFSLMIDFTLNALLFNEDVLSQKYHSGNNKLNFALSELLSIISNIIGNIFAYCILKLTNYSDAFELVEKEVKDNEEMLQIFNKFKKIIKIRLTFYFIIQFIFMCAFVYFLMIFCALYKYSQKALFKNYFLGLLTSLFYTLLISLVISLIRYLSLKCGSKKAFMLSKYLNEKL